MKNAKKKGYILLLCLGSLGIAATLVLLFYANKNLGTLLPGAAGALLAIYAILKLGAYRDRHIIRNPLARSVLRTGLALFAAFFVLLEGLILSHSSSREMRETEYLIVLGAGVRGQTVSPTLRERLDRGLQYLQAYPEAKVILSGGQGYGEQISEAEAMKRYLLAAGIAKERILTENRSTSTMENFKYTRQLLAEAGETVSELTVVTSDFHMLRAKLLAGRNGFAAYGITSGTPASVRLNNYIREYFGLVKSYLFDR
jgi:uncharacterized SAM-binding protein YcdF (DUF218 family)